VDKIELTMVDHICDLGDKYFVVACDDERRGHWYIQDLDGENMINPITHCPFCGKNLHDMNKIECGICEGKIELDGKDCVACQGSGWEQAPEPEDGIDAPIVHGLMDKIKEKKDEGKN